MEKTPPGTKKGAHLYLRNKETGYDLKITDKLYADFLILLERDGIDKRTFFRTLVHLYVTNNEKMIEALREIKRFIGYSNLPVGEKNKSSLKKHESIEKTMKRKKKLLDNFSMTSEEITDIFDSIEEDLLDF